MQLTHTIDIDLMNPGSPERIQAKQGENLSRRVLLRLFADGESWTIPGGANPVIRYHIHDLENGEDTSGIYDQFSDGSSACLVSENTILLIPLPQMFQKHSIVFLDVALCMDGITLATCNFEFYVNPAPADGTEPAAHSYYRVTTLEQINTELAAMQEQINATRSAYAYAAQYGFTGTEEEFGQKLAALMNT